MSCKIQNIKDKKLSKYIKEYGAEEGSRVFLKEYANLVGQFETQSPVSSKDVIDIANSLQSYNLENDTSHSLQIFDGKNWIDYNQESLKPLVKYLTKLNIDYGNSINDNQYKLYSTGIDYNANDDMSDAEFLQDFLGEFYDTDMNDFSDVDSTDVMDHLDEIPILDDDFFSEEEFNDKFQMTGTERGTGSGIAQVLRQARVKINDIRVLMGKLNLNADNIKKEISNLRKEGIKDSDDKIQSRLKRVDNIEDKISDYNISLKKLGNLLKDTELDLTIDNLRKLFDNHKEFALKIANTEDASEADLNTAINAMDMWREIRSIAFDEGVAIHEKILDALMEIENGADDITVNKIKSKASEKLIEGAKNELSINMQKSDTEYASDIDYITRITRTIADTPIKVLSTIDGWIKRANQRTHIESQSIRKKVKSIFKDLSDAKLSMDMFLDKDSDGKWTGNLIGRFTNKFHEDKDRMSTQFNKSVDSAVADTNKDSQNEKLIDAIKERNNWLKSRTFIINPEDLLTEEGRNKVKSKIVKITGDEKYADDRIIDAQMKYEKFQRDLARKTEYYQYLKSINEIKSDKELEYKINSFSKFNSPVEFIKYIDKTDLSKDIRITDDIDKYMTVIPLNNYKDGTTTEYYNNSFNSILQNPSAFKFYNEYMNLMQQMLSYLPSYSKKGLSPSFLPSIKADAWNRMSRKGLRGFFSGARREMIDSITSEAGEQGHYGKVDQYGKPIRSIPIKYMDQMATEDRSKNLEEVMYKFSEFAIGYKHLTQVEDKVALANNILRKMRGTKSTTDGSVMKDRSGYIKVKNGLINATAMVQHAIDNNFYGSRFETEGFTTAKFFNKTKDSVKIIGSVNPVPILSEYNALAKSVGKEEANNKIKEKYPDNVIIVTEKDAYKDVQNKLSDLIDDLDAGKITEEEYDRQEQAYKEIITGMGRNFVVSKFLDQVVNASYLKSFAWNPFPAIGNSTFGIIAILNHGAARLDYNPTQARWAIMLAHESAFRSIRSANLENDKLYNIAMKMGILPDVSEAIYKNKNYDLKMFGPMGMLSTGEYINRSSTMAAMMKNKTIKDLKGNERPLWEAFNDKGEWNVAEFGENKDWDGSLDEPTDNKELLKFSAKVKQINRFLHGNMDTETAPEAKRHIIGRLLSQYRLSWMAEGVAQRFDKKKYDEILERSTEGRFITTYKFFKDNGIGSGLSTMLKLMAFQGEAAFNGRKISPKDKAMVIANVRKTFHEMYYYAALWAIYLTLSAAIDDDDENKGAKYIALNTIYRIMGDISFYFSPSTFDQIFSNPIPVMSIMKDFNRFTNSVQKFAVGDDYYDEGVVAENFTRQFPVLNLYNKFQYRSDRLLINQ